MAYEVTQAPWKIPFNVAGSGPYLVKVLLSDLLFDKTDPTGATAQLPPSQWKPRTTGSGGMALPHDVVVYDPTIFNSDGTLNPSADLINRQKRGFFLTKVTYDARAPKTFVPNVEYYADKPDGQKDSTKEGYYVPKSTNASLVPTDALDYRTSDQTFNLYMPPAGSSYYLANDYYTQSVKVGVEGSTLEGAASLVLASRDEALEATIPGSSLVPYTRVRINADANLSEVYNLIRFFTGFRVGLTGANSLKAGRPTSAIALDTLNPTINTRLQTVEVWVRCGYFADYVNPSSYMQDLTAGSDVQHNNIIVGQGDFARYSRSASDSAPYVPKTPPREDVLTSALIASVSAGTFPVPPLTGDSVNAGTGRATPLGWYDPDFDASLPAGYSAVPNSGNFFTSGRIFSPTVDELWTFVKKVVSGRDIDANITEGPKASTATKTNAASTRLKAEPALALASSKIGDPLDAAGTTFVNAPEGITYTLNTSLQYIANKVYTDYTNFQPFATHSATAANISTKPRIAAGTLYSSGDWAPRVEPMSLRELEAAIRNCNFNMETAFNFVAARFVQIGETASGDTTKVGTLYQLHKGYAFNADTHEGNTKWAVTGATVAAGQTTSAVNGSITTQDDGTSYGSTLPGATAYDRVIHQSAQDVYLSAEGQWRYLFDHVRIPVLTETY